MRIRVLDQGSPVADQSPSRFVQLLAELDGAIAGRIGVGLLTDGHWAVQLPDQTTSMQQETLVQLLTSAAQYVSGQLQEVGPAVVSPLWLQCLVLPDDPRVTELEAAGFEKLSDVVRFESTVAALCSALSSESQSDAARSKTHEVSPVELANAATASPLIRLIDHVLKTSDAIERLPQTTAATCWSDWTVQESTSIHIVRENGTSQEVDGILVVRGTAPNASDHCREIAFIGVRSGQRRSGVASAMMRSVFCLPDGTGGADSDLEVTCAAENASAMAFYRKLGFVEVQRFHLFGTPIVAHGNE